MTTSAMNQAGHDTRRRLASGRRWLGGVLLLLGFSVGLLGQASGLALAQEAPKKFKILHIMSYHSPWEWTDDQLRGFQQALEGVDAEYKVFQMDTKRKSSEEWKEQVGREARDLI